MIDYNSFSEYLEHEDFTPIFADYDGASDDYKRALAFVCENILCESRDADQIITNYTNDIARLSNFLLIDEVLTILSDANELMKGSNGTNEYDEEELKANGYIKSSFVIHAHDSHKAPFHWDLRFKTEFGTSAFSFVLLRHKMPEAVGERLLVKQQPMHPPAWVDMDHTQIGEGYGKGSVTTVDRGTIYYKQKDRSFNIYLMGNTYRGAYHLINLRNSLYLLFIADKSILPTPEERVVEWVNYAKSFVAYLRKTLKYKFNMSDDELQFEVTDKTPILDKEAYNKLQLPKMALPSIKYCMQLHDNVEQITSPQSHINGVEDVMRLLILRNTFAPIFFNKLKKRTSIGIEQIFDDVVDVDYSDPELESMHMSNPTLFRHEKVTRMFADIYLGHKYYAHFDFEAYLAKLIAKA